MPGENHMFLKNGSKIFFEGRLDRANQVEFVRENCGFGASGFENRRASTIFQSTRNERTKTLAG
jgi:hypothetical protein